jgi:hypothetical protein
VYFQVTEFLNWLNPKGVRELALKNIINKWWYLIGPGLRRRSNVSHCSDSASSRLLTLLAPGLGEPG